MNKVAEFYAKAMEEEASKKEFLAIVGEKELEELTDEEFEKLEELAKRIGFDITAEEAKSYLQPSEELSDESLDSVAGGFRTCRSFYDSVNIYPELSTQAPKKNNY